MGRRDKITAGQRLAFGITVALVVALCFYSGEPGVGLFVILAIFVPYLAVAAPFRCRTAVRRDGSPCRRPGMGLLFGCHDHRFQRFQRSFHRGQLVPRPVREARRRGAHSGPIPPVGATQPARDRLAFAVAVVSMLAGVAALFIDPDTWGKLF
jgi:hypothetical protein